MINFFLKDIDRDLFFNEFWRRKPLYISNGFKEFCTHLYTESELTHLANLLEKRKPGFVRHDSDRATFAQNIDSVTPKLEELVACIASHLGWRNTWLDASIMKDNASIGCHYDDSDNFIMQQQGVKIWKIHPPNIIPDRELKQRMLGDPTVGNIYMPDNALEFVLKPGDILYVPIFWPHWGVSAGCSSSLSVVCNSSNAIQELLPLLIRNLIEVPLWWQPLPYSLRTNFSSNTKEDQQQIYSILSKLLESLTDSSLQKNLVSEYTNARQLKNKKNYYSKMVMNETNNVILGRTSESSCKAEMTFDFDKLNNIFSNKCSDINLGDLVIPSADRSSSNRLKRLTSLLYLKRLLTTCHRLYLALQDEAHECSLLKLITNFQCLPEHVILDEVFRPEIISWIIYTNEAIQFSYKPQLELLVRHLGSFLLSSLLMENALKLGESLIISPTTRCSLELRSMGYRISFTKNLPEKLKVTRTLSGLAINNADGQFIDEIELPLKSEESNSSSTVVYWNKIPHLLNDGPILLQRHNWYENFFPSDSKKRICPIHFDISDREFEYFSDCMSDGARIIFQYFPDTWSRITAFIQAIAPLNSQGMMPHNASIEGFRGLITSSPRPSYLAAQTLCHETGHNIFSSISDVFKLFNNDISTMAYSPFVEEMRPLNTLAHGIFAFLQDIHLSLRIRDHIDQIDELSIERYIEKTSKKVQQGLNNLKRKSNLTIHGDQMISGFDEALSVIQ
ncbi:JmjC domain-containing protein [Pleurocapsa sp. PCC 7319]|uniref:JmjC domain-containing protein n=1 Tax=Pleurocapsa sp. PCC 7319 TaxID=118161 RepID=UPI00034A61EE|nr:cupin domain-containing protein [Pleurocapsa sp. PCC 7319]